jgi:two-component system chemotaxis sensor kinase CheA
LLPLVRLATVLGLTPTIVDPHSGEKKEDARSRWSDRRGTPEQQQKESDAHAKERRSGMPDRRSAVGNAVKIAILRVESNQFGLVVDDVHDSEEIVVKPLPGYLKGSTCFAGATIMGDGKVAMILDPSGIASMAQLRFEEIESVAQQRKKQQQRVHTALQENLLLFSIGSSERFAVNVSQVSRIEKRHRSEIEKVGDKEFLTYDDSSLQLFRFERFLPVQAPDTQLEELFVLIPTHAGERVGLVAAQVEDTVQTRITLDTQAVSGPGIRGTSIINDAMTVVVNMPELLETIGVTATTG